MRLTILFFVLPLAIFGNTTPKQQKSRISQVTVYLSGAEITRTASLELGEGSSTIRFTGLSHKIDESSIQVSGLGSASILSIDYDKNYLEQKLYNPQVKLWEGQVEALSHQKTRLRNQIYGLEEEEKVITTNRMVSTDNQSLSLEKVKQISQYYRERITAIKDAIFNTQLKIRELDKQILDLQRQLAEANQSPEKQQGEIIITFDTSRPTSLKLSLKYMVSGAGWVPNYDIKSSAMNAPLDLTYKANVYQKTGQNWEDVQLTLSTGNPNYNISKPELESHFLNFSTSYSRRFRQAQKKKGYAFNPSVKKVAGTITDASGLPLPGVNVVVKGTSMGTQTDFDGNYELEVPYGQELSFSYIGMHSEELPIYASIMNLSLEEDAESLEEVVVTGMGIKREKKALGYAVTSAPSENYDLRADQEVSSALAGSAAGVQIRGMTSIKGYNRHEQAPLYIIDGVPVAGFEEGDLDSSEIQNISILKNFEATSLYGDQAASGVVLITTKKSDAIEGATKTEFVIKKPYTIETDNDITAVEINSFKVPATYEYFAAPLIDENVYLTARFGNWEQHQLLPGEANIYFEGTYAGKTVLDPYTTNKEMTLSLGIDPNITVSRKQQKNFKSKSFTGSNRIVDRTYVLETKNNKGVPVQMKLMDRIPKSQNKEIKIDNLEWADAKMDAEKGLLSWDLNLAAGAASIKTFSFQVKYPRGRYINL